MLLTKIDFKNHTLQTCKNNLSFPNTDSAAESRCLNLQLFIIQIFVTPLVTAKRKKPEIDKSIFTEISLRLLHSRRFVVSEISKLTSGVTAYSDNPGLFIRRRICRQLPNASKFGFRQPHRFSIAYHWAWVRLVASIDLLPLKGFLKCSLDALWRFVF